MTLEGEVTMDKMGGDRKERDKKIVDRMERTRMGGVGEGDRRRRGRRSRK